MSAARARDHRLPSPDDAIDRSRGGRPHEHRRRRARQDRPAARRAVRRRRDTTSSAPTSTPRPSRHGQRGHRALPGRGAPAGASSASSCPAGRLRATTDYADAVPERRRRRGRRAAVRRRGRRDPTSAGWTRPPSTSAAHLTAAPWSPTRRPCRSAPPATRWKPLLEQRLRPDRGHRLPRGLLARSGCSPAASSPTCASTRSSSAACPTTARSAPIGVLREPCSTSTSAPTCPGRNGVWDLGSAEAAELAKLAETTYRDVNIGLANQFARFADGQRHRRLPGDRGLQLAAVQPHPPAGHRGRRPLHPGLPAAVPVERPGGDRRARGPRGQRRHAGVRGRPARRAPTATSPARASSCWAPPTAAG